MAQHSIFGGTVPATPGSFSDANPDSWLGTQFYIPEGETLTLSVTGVRIYVPAGSALIGKTGFIGFIRRALADGGIYMSDTVLPSTAFETNGARTAIATPLVAGWNNIPLSAQWPMEPGDGVIVGYRIDNGTYYLFDNALTDDPILDVDALGFYMAPSNVGITAPGRSWYSVSGWTAARWYGLDVLVDDGATPPPSGDFGAAWAIGPASFDGESPVVPPAVGEFAAAYTFGPSAAAGEVDARGSFTSPILFGPATAEGAAQHHGDFGAAYAFGPAAAEGASPRSGSFAGGYAFGPAAASGETPVSPAVGDFAATFRYGPAGFVGTLNPDLCWPTPMGLVPEGPTVTLVPEGPVMILVEDGCRP